ncbi:MAG: hypothetical protein WC869_02850 [Phycisphaerae bacterium]|jgi:hypothetical protein
MANDPHELRGINWNEVFPFTHIFKSFRIAMHPSKLMLALAAVVLVYFCGRVMDGMWGAAGSRAMRGEIDKYLAVPAGEFSAAKADWKNGRIEAVARLAADAHREAHDLTAFTQSLPYGPFSDAFREKLAKANADEKAGQYESRSASFYLEDARKSWRKVYVAARRDADDEADRISDLLAQTRKEKKEYDADYNKGMQLLTAREKAFTEQAQAIRGNGIFQSLLIHEATCINNAISSVWHANLLGGLIVEGEAGGFLYWVIRGVKGAAWMLSQHCVFGIIFLAVALAAWALFGGAIHRIAALQFARDEKMSMSQALRFSSGKFISFFSAPLIPLGLILLLGLLLAIGGLVLNLWGVGAFIAGLLFFLAIIAGFAIAFLIVGLVCGSSLMYPAIAVEGSDNFDAISRGFSYVFDRPWRAAWYGLVAVVFGSVWYLVVRVFAWLALASAHYFANWGVFTGGKGLGEGATRLDVLWSAPTLMDLHGPFNWAIMSGGEKAGAFLVAFWVYLVSALLGAFLLSYIASSTTIIYCLLRRKVDATEMNEVYIEEDIQQAAPSDASSATEQGNPPAQSPAPQDATPPPSEDKPA